MARRALSPREAGKPNGLQPRTQGGVRWLFRGNGGRQDRRGKRDRDRFDRRFDPQIHNKGIVAEARGRLGSDCFQFKSDPAEVQIEDYPQGGAERMSAILDTPSADFSGQSRQGAELDGAADRCSGAWPDLGGKDALAVGLIDAIGGMDAALDELRALLKLPPAAPFRLVDLPAPSKIEQFLMALQEQGIDIRGAANWLMAAPTPSRMPLPSLARRRMFLSCLTAFCRCRLADRRIKLQRRL